jgi:hypothetical protein
MQPTVAFVADGALYRLESGKAPERLESPFGLEVRGRAQEIQRRHAWKSEGRGAMFMSRGLLWGGAGADPNRLQVQVTDIAHGTPAGELLYAMLAEGRTAVCRLRPDGVERRLLHGSERRLEDLALSPAGAELACSVAHPDGSASLAVMTADATDLAEVTEGEARDAAPSWAPTGRRLVYESAGVGRDAQGRFAGLGPSTIHAIDLDQGAVEEFTARYTGKPLTTAGGPRRAGADIRRMQQWSNLIEAEADANEEEAHPATPKSWQLVRQRPDGRREVVAESALSYDIDAEGRVVYTTGSAIHLIEAGGAPRRRLLTQGGIRQVVFTG